MKKIIKKQFWFNLFKLIKKGILTRKKQGIILIIVSVSIGLYLGLGSSLLGFLFLAFAFYDWDNRVIGVLALISLTSCPFLLEFNQDVIAEQMATYAFFFLTIVVVLQLIEYKRHTELFIKDKNEEK